MFGLGSLVAKLTNGRVHDLSNVLTLRAELHGEFDSLRLWFEEIEGMTNCVSVSFSDLG